MQEGHKLEVAMGTDSSAGPTSQEYVTETFT